MKTAFMMAMAFMLLSFNLVAKVRETDFNVTGALENFDQSVIKIKSGTVKLIDSKNCGFFKCHARNFIFRNEEGSVSVSLDKNGIKGFFEYDVRGFGYDEITRNFKEFSLTSKDGQLKLNFNRILKDKTEEYKYTIIPESCKDICTESHQECRLGEEDSDGTCSQHNTENVCDRWETECVPSYEVCYHEVKSKASLIIDILKIETNTLAGRFTSKEIPHLDQTKVPMPKCFGK